MKATILKDFYIIEKIFRGVGITPEWLYALSNGKTILYNEDEILNYYIKDNILVINSGSIDNSRFSIAIIKDIITLAKSQDKVILSSSVKNIECFMNKHNFNYNSNITAYIKGI